MNDSNVIADDWWPDQLKEFALDDPSMHEEVSLAEIKAPQDNCTRGELYTISALATPEEANSILTHKGCPSCGIQASGPYPWPEPGYVPRFWIYASNIIPDGIEPLVVSWDAVDKVIFLPDQGLLMTYGLTPRIVRSENGDMMIWDELRHPRCNIIKAKMVSEYNFPNLTEAWIRVKREYIEDYASLRDRVVIQVYRIKVWTLPTDEIIEVLNGQRSKSIKLPGRTIYLSTASDNSDEILIEVIGTRRLFDPGKWPISKEQNDCDNLTWPCIQKPITKKKALEMVDHEEFIDDAVLGMYEDQPHRYRILPETGGVYYKNQWSIDRCSRVGRNLLKIELRKLYEGAPPQEVLHWNRFAVKPPQGNIAELRKSPNVATRAKKIVYALCELGQALADLSSNCPNLHLDDKDFVQLSKADLDYYGWQKNAEVAPITHHIPIDIGEARFLTRCQALNHLVIEGLAEGNLRKLISCLGIDKKETGTFKSLKLLNVLLQHCLTASDSALQLISDGTEIEKRRKEEIKNLGGPTHFKTPICILDTLNKLRNKSSHRGNNTDKLLERLETDRSSLESGWGILLDKLYDKIADSLDEAAKVIRNSIE